MPSLLAIFFARHTNHLHIGNGHAYTGILQFPRVNFSPPRKIMSQCGLQCYISFVVHGGKVAGMHPSRSVNSPHWLLSGCSSSQALWNSRVCRIHLCCIAVRYRPCFRSMIFISEMILHHANGAHLFFKWSVCVCVETGDVSVMP